MPMEFHIDVVEAVWRELKAYVDVQDETDETGYRAASKMLDIFETGFGLPRTRPQTKKE